MKASEVAKATGRVRLRDVTEDDLPIFFDHQRDPVANRMAAFPARERDAFFEQLRVHEALNALEPRNLNDLRSTLPGLDEPDDIEILQLTLPPDRDVFSVTSQLRGELV